MGFNMATSIFLLFLIILGLKLNLNLYNWRYLILFLNSLVFWLLCFLFFFDLNIPGEFFFYFLLFCLTISFLSVMLVFFCIDLFSNNDWHFIVFLGILDINMLYNIVAIFFLLSFLGLV